MSTVFLTGFPGFLGSELLPKVLEARPEARALCLVQPKFSTVAIGRLESLTERFPTLAGRVDLIEGDITEPGLAIEDQTAAREVTEIYHLAAVYDLMVKREVGMLVNVEGTRNILDFAEDCTSLTRLHYISTCYVSGRYAGLFREADLDVGQSFNNYYEETKFLAEVEVQARRNDGLPTTIYRPSVVVGDSESGETQKYDGPYFVMRWLMRQPRIALLPVVGDPTTTRVNLVPRDFMINAISYLSSLDQSLDQVYQLADPHPLTVDELIDAIADVTNRQVLRVPALRSAAKAALDYLPGAQWMMQMPSAAVDYFVHPTHYATDNAERDLAGSGIAVPPFRSYLPHLVEFMRENPTIGSEAMV